MPTFPERERKRHRRSTARCRGSGRSRAGTGLFLVACLAALSATASADEPAEAEEPQPESILRRGGNAPRFSLHGFADITVTGERVDPAGGDSATSSGVALGQLDLYIVSHLTDNISFLTETVFEQDTGEEGEVHVERMFIKYTVSDLLWISAGRRHNPLSYWNETFHHGLLLQPTIERPEALRFEDDERGGFLPVHIVGIGVGGRRHFDAWGVDYAAHFSNGRSDSRKVVQGAGDANDQKALSLKLSFSRDGDSRLVIGPTVHLDDIPADPGTPGRENEMDESILGAHAAFRSEHIDVISEYFRVRHEDKVTGSDFVHPAYYSIVVWRTYRWKPYVSYDRLDVESGDPFLDGVSNLERYVLGVRFDLNPFNALKFEYRRDKRPGADSDVLAAQVAFTF